MTDSSEPVQAEYGDESSPFRPAGEAPLLERAIPVAGEIPNYRPRTARGDVLGGVTVAALALPAAMAYAEVAGLSPVHGLYALLLPALAYALFGSSRQLILGPEGSIAALVAAAVLPLAAAGSDAAAAAAASRRRLFSRRTPGPPRLDRGLLLASSADRLHPRCRRRAHRGSARQGVRHSG